MILYTALPIELVMSVEDKTSPYKDVSMNGIPLVVEPTATGMGKIIQVKSTDPQVYLRPEFQPGQQVPMSHI